MAKRTLDELVQERYSHPDVQQAILAEIQQNETADKILSGQLTLPSEHDAIRHISGLSTQEDLLAKQRAGLPEGKNYDPAKHAEATLKHRQLTEGQ